MKINIRKVLFIMLCAELFIWYYSHPDFLESPKETVQSHNPEDRKPTVQGNINPGAEKPAAAPRAS